MFKWDRWKRMRENHRAFTNSGWTVPSHRELIVLSSTTLNGAPVPCFVPADCPEGSHFIWSFITKKTKRHPSCPWACATETLTL